MKTVFVILVIVSVGLGSYFLWKNSPGKPKEKETQVTQVVTTEEIQKIAVEGSDFSMNPERIEVTVGKKVAFTFTNTGQAAHNWVLEDMAIQTKVLAPGESETLEFTPERTGEYSFYCSLPGHREKGMEGVVVVK